MPKFVSLLEKSRERAIYMRIQVDKDEEGLRECQDSDDTVLTVETWEGI